MPKEDILCSSIEAGSNADESGYTHLGDDRFGVGLGRSETHRKPKENQTETDSTPYSYRNHGTADLRFLGYTCLSIQQAPALSGW